MKDILETVSLNIVKLVWIYVNLRPKYMNFLLLIFEIGVMRMFSIGTGSTSKSWWPMIFLQLHIQSSICGWVSYIYILKMLVVTNLSTADPCHQCYVLVISTKFIEIVSPEIIIVNNALEFDAIKKNQWYRE